MSQHSNLAWLRPGYNGTALAAALAAGAPAWASTLANVARTGDGSGVLGLTAAGLLVTAAADRFLCYRDRKGQRHELWIPRVAVFTVATAPLYEHHTAHWILALLTGAAS